MVDLLGDLKQELEELKRKIRVLESASPLGYTSISEGALEIRSEEGLIVIGSVRISGVMNGDGTITWTGPWNLTGPGDVTGDVAWSGDLNLTGDIKVLAGGKIQVGDMIIDPSNGGSVTFPGNAVVRGQAGNGVEVTAGAYTATVREGYARFGTSAVNFVVDGFTGLSINGLTDTSGLGTPRGTLHALDDGRLRRSNGL